jgi:hypothetical protein
MRHKRVSKIVEGRSHNPLPRELLIRRGFCCGMKCQNCPYSPKHTYGSNKTTARTKKAKERK